MTADLLHHGRYRVEQPLGTGAMGIVVLARDTVLDRRGAGQVRADHLAASHGLVTAAGVTKLTDFGIARALADNGLTEIGTVLGTAHFMAPEQAAGAPFGPAADVFALGAVLRHVAGDSLPAGLEPLVDAAL